MRYYISIRTAIIKKIATPNSGNDAEYTLIFHTLPVGTYKGYSHSGKEFGCLS